MARRLFFTSLTPFTFLGFSTFNAELYLPSLIGSDMVGKGIYQKLEPKRTKHTRNFLI